MANGARVAVLVLINIVIFAFSETGITAENVTVITESRIYRNVGYEFRLIESDVVLRIFRDSLVNDIRLSDIVAIQDKNGNNITNEVLSR